MAWQHPLPGLFYGEIPMIFRKATQADRAAVYALYRSLVGTPRCTWDENYPGWLQINEDLAAGGLYVMAQGDSILGAISIVAENELDALPCWKCRMAKEIARVAVTPGQQGKGIGFAMAQNVCAMLAQQGVPAVHLLVSPENAPAQRIYQKCGFEYLGPCTMFGLDFLACEKRL